MIRQIICPECVELKPMPLEDIAAGWRRRRRWIKLHASMGCDLCGKLLPPEHMAQAGTMWQGGSEPPDWESSYGAIQP